MVVLAEDISLVMFSELSLEGCTVRAPNFLGNREKHVASPHLAGVPTVVHATCYNEEIIHIYSNNNVLNE